MCCKEPSTTSINININDPENENNINSEDSKTKTWLSSDKTNWYQEDDGSSAGPCKEQDVEYPYDRSSDEGLSNCCFGKAINTYEGECEGESDSCCQKMIRCESFDRSICSGNENTNNDCCDVPEFKPNSEKHEWGGDAKECIGGPVRASEWEHYRRDISLNTEIPGA